MKKYAVILTCMALSLSLSFAQNDTGASQPGAAAGASTSSDSSSPDSSTSSSGQSSTEQSGQAADQSQTDAERIVAEPAGAGQQQQVGSITIEGTVQSAEEKKAIEDHLKTMPGVKNIDNKLTVVGDVSEPAGASTEEDSSKAESEESDSTDSPDSSSDTQQSSPEQSSPDQSSQTP